MVLAAQRNVVFAVPHAPLGTSARPWAALTADGQNWDNPRRRIGSRRRTPSQAPGVSPPATVFPVGPAVITLGQDLGLSATPGYDDVTGVGSPAPGFFRIGHRG